MTAFFYRNPFNIELWQYDRLAGNKLMGVAQLPVQQLPSLVPLAVVVRDRQATQRKLSLTLAITGDNGQK